MNGQTTTAFSLQRSRRHYENRINRGEASGDKLGAALIDGFDAILEQPADFIGVAGPRMMARGMDSLFAMQELSVMGIVEILKQYPRLKRRLNETADYIIAQNPDVLITIDALNFPCAWRKYPCQIGYSHGPLCGTHRLGVAPQTRG